MPRRLSKEKEQNRHIPPWAVRMKELRKDHDMTQADAAKLLNVSQRTYADYELGVVRIPVDCLVRLAYHYNTSMDYISAVCTDGHINKSYIPDLPDNTN